MAQEKKYVVGYDYLDWIDPIDVVKENWVFQQHDKELGVDVVYNSEIDVYCYTDYDEVWKILCRMSEQLDGVLKTLFGDDYGA